MAADHLQEHRVLARSGAARIPASALTDIRPPFLTAVPAGRKLSDRDFRIAAPHPLPPRPAPELPCDVGRRFGSRLRELRRSRSMTQLQMAVLFGIDRSYISEIECGKKGVSLATLEVIAIGCGMPLSDLLASL